MTTNARVRRRRRGRRGAVAAADMRLPRMLVGYPRRCRRVFRLSRIDGVLLYLPYRLFVIACAIIPSLTHPPTSSHSAAKEYPNLTYPTGASSPLTAPSPLRRLPRAPLLALSSISRSTAPRCRVLHPRGSCSCSRVHPPIVHPPMCGCGAAQCGLPRTQAHIETRGAAAGV
jgi:hypothetical protein